MDGVDCWGKETETDTAADWCKLKSGTRTCQRFRNYERLLWCDFINEKNSCLLSFSSSINQFCPVLNLKGMIAKWKRINPCTKTSMVHFPNFSFSLLEVITNLSRGRGGFECLLQYRCGSLIEKHPSMRVSRMLLHHWYFLLKALLSLNRSAVLQSSVRKLNWPSAKWCRTLNCY